MAGVNLNGVRKDYAGVVAVESTDLDVQQGELLALLGPSGCGKTTTLRMIAGFVPPSGGSIFLGPRDVTHVPVHKRNVGMVFQGYALLPHLTVRRNIEFGMRVRRWERRKIDQRLEEMLRWVQLGALAERYPKELSGGQQQRVALARAMAIEPAVLLLDEPFSALDAKLRTQLRVEMRQFQRQAGITSVFVTHDQEEAMAMADRIAVMNQGRLEQVGTAQDLYERPSSRFVANFIGKCNMVAGRSTNGEVFERDDGTAMKFSGPSNPGASILCFRPERSRLSASPFPDQNSLPVNVRSVTYLGAHIEYELESNSGEKFITTVATSDASARFDSGAACFLVWKAEDCFVLA